MENLLFNNPVFHGGLNFTVRLGEKWKSNVSVGDLVKIFYENPELIESEVS